ncbi:MAG: carbon-nitrogen hydrolase family protein [Pseudomonadota bacterium]
MPTSIRITAVQAAPKLFDPVETEALFEHWLTRAAKDGADLVVFPDSFLGGYPKGVDFGARVGSRDAAGRELFRRYFECGYDRAGEAFARIRSLVADAGVNVVTGIMEQVGGTLYCSAATIARDGALAGWHRKLVPTAMERIIWGQGDGSTIAAAQTDIGTVGTAICWENYMPLLRTHLYGQGTQIYAAPTVDDRDQWQPTMQMIALEGRCFVVSACQYMTRADVADDVDYDAIQGGEPGTVLIRGGSTIISPFGEVLAASTYGEAGLVSAEIDLAEIGRAKFDLDVTGHYARPDVFRLEVDTTARILNG